MIRTGEFDLSWFQFLYMKEGLRKIRGTSLATDIGEITLIDTFREEDCEYDQLYFSTEHDSIAVKVYDLQKEESLDRFRHEEEVYLSQVYDEMAEPLTIREIQIKKNPYGLIALKIARGSTLKESSGSLNYQDWLTLAEFSLNFIQKLKNHKQVYLNFQPSNISRNSFGQFRITDPQFMSTEGSYQDLSASQEQLIDLCEKEYLYRAPQLLDQYCKGKVDYKSDLYSFAIVLYELIYRQYPFESKLAQISCNYRPFPDDSFFSSFISKILKPYIQRESLENLKFMLEAERKKVPKQLNIKSLNSGSTAQSKSGGIFSGLTQMFSKLTTETESWYLNFTENDDSAPEQKYLNLIVNKLYKKETKLDKLHLVMLKYLQEGTLPQDQNRFLKTVVLMIQLFRRGPQMINYQWGELLELLQSKASGDLVLTELCQFCRHKMSFNSKYKTIFRGNFFIEDLSKFKLVTVEVLEDLLKYLSWVTDSIKTKLLFIKKDKGVLSYAKELYCDEIMDIISMLIFAVICLRKDNELKIRKDPLEKIGAIEKKMNSQLQKISYLSNHVNAHPIYSLEAEYSYYQEEMQIRESPCYTSLEHFYKYSRQYKGLCIPQNFALNYSSGDQKEFLSNENNRNQKSPEHKHKNYFVDDDEEEYENDLSLRVQKPQSPDKKEIKQKILQILNEKPKRIVQPSPEFNFFQLKRDNSDGKQEAAKKIVTFDDFFKMQAKSGCDQPNNNLDLFDFNKKEVEMKKIKSNDDFSFFDAFVDDKNKKMKQIQKKDKKVEQNFNNFFQNFGAPKELKNIKSALSGSSSQKIIQDNLLNIGNMKKSSIPISSPQKSIPNPQIDPGLLNDILSGLKLKELKEMILNNQQIIIDFTKLKLEKVIGSGSAGEVYVGKYNNQILAIKKVKTKQNPNALKQFERELVTYIKIKRNPYLVSLVGLSKSGGDYYLLTEFCNSGSLFDLLHKKANSVALSWKQRIALAIQIAKGMAALHEMSPPIIHRDLKSLNVFVSETNKVFTAKVADFGLSRSPEAEMMTMYLGTLHWMAPQLLDNKQYSNRVDIYSFAIVLWQICSRKTPYNELSSPMAIIKHVTMEKKRPNLSLIPPDCPPELLDIMKACWSQEPNDRPLFNVIIERLSKINMIF